MTYVDDTYLYVFNDGFMYTLEVSTKAQRLLNAWHEELRFTGGYLKLSNATGRCKTIVGKMVIAYIPPRLLTR